MLRRFIVRAAITGGLGIAWLGGAPAARAERPVLTGEATFGQPGGDVLIHYATSGLDAVAAGDTDRDGVPDFVAEVAASAELALDHYVALGFRRPVDDGALGGDGRIDIYLQNLMAADGNVTSDSCTAGRCIGHAIAENDFAGYSYPSITEAIRSVVPHEMFHLVQLAYSSAQPASWTEGSAVWAVENLYGADNSDFERFLPAFLTKSFRPFERPIGGFGDAYPYGAALWPYFLEHRFSAGVVVDAWEASEQAMFLAAAEAALGPVGSSVDAAWVEMTRWNAFTGARAAGGPYPDAAGWRDVPRETAMTASGMIYIEGLSARYVPIAITERSQIALVPMSGIRIAGWLVAETGSFTDGVELAADPGGLAATVDAGAYLLVVTGLTRNAIASAVAVTIEPDASEPGGCSASAAPSAPSLVLGWLVWALARRPPHRRTPRDR